MQTDEDVEQASMPPKDGEIRPALQGPKRQHYLPRFYLEGFVGQDGCLAVYDRSKGEIRRQRPINTAVSGHIYTMTDGQGRKRFELEAHLSKVESDAAQHLPTLIAGRPLDKQARYSIALFVAFLAVRTPEFIDSVQQSQGDLLKFVSQTMFSNQEFVVQQLRKDPKYEGKSEQEIEALATDLIRFAQEGDYTVETSYEHAMTTALPLAESTAPYLYDRHWTIWSAPRGSAFVTADAPVVLTSVRPQRANRHGIGFGSPDALVITPLSSTHALAMYDNGGKTSALSIDGRLTRQLNLDMARGSQRFLLARDDALVLAVSKAARLDETAWEPRFVSNRPQGRKPRR